MLTKQLTHPTLAEAFAAAGHDSKAPIAHSNCLHATAHRPNGQVCHLNRNRGVVSGPDMLTTITGLIRVKSAAVTVQGTDLLPGREAYEPLRGARVRFGIMEVLGSERAACGEDFALLPATGENRVVADSLVTLVVASEN